MGQASKGGSTTYSTPELTPEQRQRIVAENELFTGTIAPNIKEAVEGASELYNTSAGGVKNAAQNLAGTASQVGQTTGEVGESALRTGVSGLQSLFSPEYAQEQLNAAMAPAQAQYEQNLQNQAAQFGGTGNLGSSRQALAQTQLAGQTQSAQAATAAGILKDIAAQRAGVGAQLAQIGSGGLGQALGAAQAGIGAAMTPQDYFNKYLAGPYGAPTASYGSIGPYGTSGGSSNSSIGLKI
jgi:hypothetical protein